MKLLLGSEFAYEHCSLVAIATDLKSWGDLCEFITAARRDAQKGRYRVVWPANLELLAGCQVLYIPKQNNTGGINLVTACAGLIAAKGIFGRNLWLGVQLSNRLGDDLVLRGLQTLSVRTGVSLVVAGNVQMHIPERKQLHDVTTAIRLGQSVANCGFSANNNAEQYLCSRAQLARTYPPQLLANTLEVASRCHFSLDEIRYNYPTETVPAGCTPIQALTQLVMTGAARRYRPPAHPDGVPAQILAWLHKELGLIAQCQYEMFFLTVHDIVRFAQSVGILCQGRGSAANSVVCYCLGITAADPMLSHPLLERFISVNRRNEPPDIDVDFEHQRREEVIQYIYTKYGRERAAIAAVITCFRRRSALRDVGKALEIPDALIQAFVNEHHWFDAELLVQRIPELLEQMQPKPSVAPGQIEQWLNLTDELEGFPRHLSQHVGGFVLTQDKLCRIVPVEPATMEGRSVIQWEKDDLEAMGLMKVDVLALGILTAIRRCLDLRNHLRNTDGQAPWGLADIPPDDSATYNMICAADTVGVFQIESRAQMSMLPRLLPRTFYDLVVEVAIVRPGPIAGGMVHPYLKARQRQREGLATTYEKPGLKPALERTLGIPIFQEQVMQIAMIAAGFSPEQADALRRSMAAWKKRGGVDKFHQPLIDGMIANGYSIEFAHRIFEQIKGFGEYGFPESHAYSFALITYASSWLKCHEPACFLAALLNSQPLGFYDPGQLVQDATRHGVEVLPVDVANSDWDCTLQPLVEIQSDKTQGDGKRNLNVTQPAVRLGLRLVHSLSEAAAQRIVQVRRQAPYCSTEDLVRRAALNKQEAVALAAADALASLSGHRRQQVWDAAVHMHTNALLHSAPINESPTNLPSAPEGEDILFDYAATGLSLRRHPLALLRPRLIREQILTAAQLQNALHGQQVHACGIVNVRQRPQTAKGTMFVTLEDETGTVNVIVWPQIVENQRQPLLQAQLLSVKGIWQFDVASGGKVKHLIARQLTDMTALLGRLAQHGGRSRDFR